MAGEPWAPTLAAYRREKWAQLEEEGPERLRIELAWLDDFLARVDRGEPLDMEVNVDFRRAKAAVLREILDSRP